MIKIARPCTLTIFITQQEKTNIISPMVKPRRNMSELSEPNVTETFKNEADNETDPNEKSIRAEKRMIRKCWWLLLPLIAAGITFM